MPEKSIQKVLVETFPPTKKDLWVAAAMQEAEGKDPLEILKWIDNDNLKYLPYYDRENVASLNYLKKFDAVPSSIPYLGARAWFNLPQILITDTSEANLKALQLLNQGADGIYFRTTQENVDFEKLLQNIEWPYCSLSFELSEALFSTYLKHLRQKKYDTYLLQGILYWKKNPDNLYSILTSLESQPKIIPFGLIIQNSSPVTEITEALKKGVDIVEALLQENISVPKAFASIAFSLHADQHFFSTIAKIKVLRMLWFQVAQAYGQKQFQPEDLHIHVESSPWIEEKFQPHGNMLKSTTTALASVIGGCNSLSVVPELDSNNTVSRIACNVSNILREESYVDKVVDPLAGCYALESMVDQLAQQAWKNFQSVTNTQN